MENQQKLLVRGVLVRPKCTPARNELTHRSLNKELCWAAARAQPRATLSEELIVRCTRPLPFAAAIHQAMCIAPSVRKATVKEKKIAGQEFRTVDVSHDSARRTSRTATTVKLVRLDRK